jgi:large subunit ribosomal protein L10
MVTKSQKETTVSELKEKFSKAKSVYTTQQLGLSVAAITKLRREIRPMSADFKIAKNTLFRIAAQGTQFEDLTKELKGPSALVFCYDDAIAPLGKVKKFSSDNKDLVTIEGGLLEGDLLDKAKATEVAGLPSKDVLLSQIAGMLVQNTQSIAYILDQLGNNEDQAKLLKDFIVANSPVESASNSGETNEGQA